MVGTWVGERGGIDVHEENKKWGECLSVARAGTEVRTQGFQESSLVGGGGMEDLQGGYPSLQSWPLKKER